MGKAKDKFTPRERLFIQEYLVDFNGAAAARRAGYVRARRVRKKGLKASEYQEDNARQIAHELLTKPYIVAEINRELQKRTKKLELNGDFTLSRLKALADSNVLNVAQWAEGTLILKDSAALTREQGYQIDSIQMKQTLLGPELKFKMRKPDSALEMLGRNQGLFDVGDQAKSSKELEDALAVLDEEEKQKVQAPAEPKEEPTA